MKVGRSDLAASLNAVFVYGKGRPIALGMLLLLLLVNGLSELPSHGNADNSLIARTIGLPFAESRRLLFDGLQKISPRLPQAQPVTVVAIDEASLARIGQWPWPRSVLAKLIRQINEQAPAAIGLDLYMPERDQTSPDRVAANLPPEASRLAADLSRLPSHERILADALKSAPSVLGAVGVVTDANASIHGMRMTPVKVNGENALSFVREYSQVLSSLPELQEAVHGQAVLCVELDQGVVRRVPLVVGLNGQLAPGLAMEMLRVATDSSAIEVEVKRHGIETVEVADLSVPVQPEGDIWLHYASIKSTAARYVSAADVLEGKISPDHLAGKLVLVGLTGNGLNDWRTTALGELVPGVEIQAQVLETLFDGHFILRPWWMRWVETGCLLLFGGLMILWVPQSSSNATSFVNKLSRISLPLVLLFNVLFSGIAYLLFLRLGLMFDAAAFWMMTLGVMGCLIVSTMLASAQRARLLAEKEAQTERARAKLASQLENMVDALVQLIAGAIDAKSPYTGGHCERVPELAIMLAKAAAEVKEGPLADFSFENENEWREFRIGAWLHDCGKVTTPEYVVDKATKLETIYNRIHEIRTRFEVLLRDAKIAQFEAVAQGQDAEAAEAVYLARQQQLQDDFAFVAECNIGGEFMDPGKIERLKKIAEETWLRHFDDRLGLSDAELQRIASEEANLLLPAREKLIADKPQHVIPRTDQRVADPKWRFRMDIPQNLYNQGEAYNLSISRGTLTPEERYKINEHVMQSLMMLEQLPLPDHLKRVPEYAGTHHETLIGTGYPRKLGADELSIPARVIAIADIFEALTASDRPYKKPKTLSESIKILSFFKKDGHIDPDLFRLFLSSGVYLKFAEKHLAPEQMDSVDIGAYLS